MTSRNKEVKENKNKQKWMSADFLKYFIEAWLEHAKTCTNLDAIWLSVLEIIYVPMKPLQSMQ